MKRGAVILIVHLFFSSAPALGQYSLTGRVLSETLEPLASASVVLRSSTTGLQRYGRATDADGFFRFDFVGPASYTLEVSFVGYSLYRRDIDLTGEDVLELQITLDRKALPQSEVIVSATRARRQLQPVTVSNVTEEELSRVPDMKDLPVTLARYPSITQYSENGNGIGYSTLRMRGFGQRRLGISINGIPQNDPEEFNVFWINFFDIQGAVEDIQIQRGAGTSLYGSAAIGGAVNIRAMPYRPERYTRVELGGGAFATRRYSIELNSGLLSDRYVVFGRFSRLLSDGYREWSWTRFWRYFAGVTRYGTNSTLTLQAFGGPQRDGLAYSGIPKAANRSVITDAFGSRISRRYNFSSLSRDVENFSQPHFEIHHELRLNEDTRLNQALFLIQGRGYFDFGGTFRSADYLRLPSGIVPDSLRAEPLFVSKPDASVLFRAYLDQWQIGWIPRLTIERDRLKFTVGTELRLHRSLRWGRIQEATGIPSEVVGSRQDVRVYSFRGEKIIGSVFGSVLARPNERWALQADVQMTYRRYRVYDEAFFGNEFRVPYTFVNPRIGVTYNPEKAWSGYASVALAHREPRMKSLYDGEESGAGFVPGFARNQDGSFDYDRPDVRSESLVDFELGSTIQSSGYRVSANVFAMDFRNEIVPSGDLDQFGVPRTGNADRTLHLGFEAEGELDMGSGFRVDGNITLTRNRFQSFEEFVTLPDYSVTRLSRDNNPIAGFPDRSGNISLAYSRDGFVATVHTALVGRQYIDNSFGREVDGTRSDDLIVDAYTMTDASFRYAFSRSSSLSGLNLGLDVNNVFDDEVLAFGNVGFGTPQFFPLATRHVFLFARYTIR